MRSHRTQPLPLRPVRVSKRGLRVAGLLMAAVMLCGCGSSYEATVSGTVTLDGRPMDRGHGVVTFHPVEDGALAYGQIGPGGQYEIRTGRADGLTAGEYDITVQVTVMPETPGGDPNVEPLPELITPARYGTREQTDLRFTVKPGRNRIDLALSTK